MTKMRLLIAASSALALGGTGTAAQARSAGSGTERGVTTAQSGVQLTAKTVVVPRALARRNLIGIARDGTFKFRHATGALRQLKPGKVMVLEGSDGAIVKSVSHKRGRLLVHTKPAQLSDVISSGHIAFSGVPDVRKGIAINTVAAPATAAGAAVGLPPLGARQAASSTSVSGQGAVGPFGYSLTFTPASQTRVNVSGTLCFITGSACANGTATGLSAEVNIGGYLDIGEAAGTVDLNGGSVTGGTFSIGKLSGAAHLTYTVKRGEGSAAGGDPPVFRVPLGFGFPCGAAGPVPFWCKFQLALLLKLGISSKNAVLHGGIDEKIGGSDTIVDSGSSVSGSESGDSVSGEVLDQSNGKVPPSISLAPSGAVVAVQLKAGWGLGVSAANGVAFVDFVTSIGQTTGAAIAGMLCSSYDINLSFGAGFEAQVGPSALGLSLTTKKILYEKPFQTHDAGCPQV
jgi:hypothetical protein